MTLHLKWIGSPFSQEPDLPILDLDITQEENEFAKAHLVIDVKSSLPPTGTEGLIEENNKELLFKGKLIGTPVKMKGNLAHINLIALPDALSEKVNALQEKCRVAPYWDVLWIPPKKQDDLQSLQDVQTASLYCDRRTGELSFSDWFEGRKTLSVPFFPDSLEFKMVRAPLKSCTVNVHAHWVQRETGVASLSSAIRRAFPRLKVNTYTEDALFKKWPEPGHRLGRSGYWVLKSKLKPIRPMPSHYPTTSSPLPLKEEEGPIKPYRVKRAWFNPSLWIGWQVHQKRKETLTLTLTHSFQPLVPGEGTHKAMEFTLQNINPDPKSYPWRPDVFYKAGNKVFIQQKIYKCLQDHTSSLSFEKDQKMWRFKRPFHTPLGNPARASFFLTERGYLAAEHGMERAKVELAKSARCLEVSFEGPWEAFKDVTTDVSLLLSDPRLPGGQLKGKIVKHSLLAKGEIGERLGRVTLLCALGAKTRAQKETRAKPQYGEEDYCETAYQVFENKVAHTPSGLSYFRYDDQGPPTPLAQAPLARGVQLLHGPDEQEKEMQLCVHKPPSFLEKTLSQNPTRLRLFLKDIRTKDRIEHQIIVKMASPWSAPYEE